MTIRHTAGVALLGALLLAACSQISNSDNPILKIEHGNLVLIVDGAMQTQLNTTLPGTKPLTDGFQATEKLLLDGRELGRFNLDNVAETVLAGELPGREWKLEGIR
jgi:hypothetical protein